MAFSRGFLFEAAFAKIIEAGVSRWQCSSDGNTHPAGIARSAIRGIVLQKSQNAVRLNFR
jgi:hypothetical protein